MNILYITNHLNIGGISSYVLTLAKGLKKRGHRVYIASSGGQLLSRFREVGVDYIPIPIKTKKEISPQILYSMFKLSGWIKKNNIDTTPLANPALKGGDKGGFSIQPLGPLGTPGFSPGGLHLIHSHSRTTQVLGCLLSRYCGIPHISTCHGFFKKRVLRLAFPCWGIKVIAISEQVKEHLIEDFKVAEKNIVVIHNGVDVTKFLRTTNDERRTTKLAFGLNTGPVIGIVARLSDVKGHLYLIEAMQSVLARIPQAQLLIVGEGRMKPELINLTKRLAIQRNVFFAPEVPETAEVLSAMDIFVMPSLKEGLGLALMEAMAAGLAVIGSDIGGIRTLIQDGYNGLLVEPANSDALAKAIVELLLDPEKRQSLGQNARAFISENFSQEKTVRQTERLYRECLNLKN